MQYSRWVVRGESKNFSGGANRGEWIPKFMRQHREKRVLPLIRLLKRQIGLVDFGDVLPLSEDTRHGNAVWGEERLIKEVNVQLGKWATRNFMSLEFYASAQKRLTCVEYSVEQLLKALPGNVR